MLKIIQIRSENYKSSIFKYLGVSLLILIVITIFIVFFVSKEYSSKEEQKAQKKNQPSEVNEQYELNATFEGNQTQVIDLIKGRAVLNITYPGNSRFIVKLFYPSGTFITMLADLNGPYSRSYAVDVPESGAFLLEVRTSGEWSYSQN